MVAFSGKEGLIGFIISIIFTEVLFVWWMLVSSPNEIRKSWAIIKLLCFLLSCLGVFGIWAILRWALGEGYIMWIIGIVLFWAINYGLTRLFRDGK